MAEGFGIFLLMGGWCIIFLGLSWGMTGKMALFEAWLLAMTGVLANVLGIALLLGGFAHG